MLKKTLFVLFLVFVPIFAQNNYIFVAHWNLENLYDTEDDPTINDEDFTPKGMYKWTDERLVIKFVRLSEIISAMNDGKAPDVLTVCEIENRAVLNTLVMLDQFLKKFNYGVIHKDSPDRRGVDVGILYKKDIFDFVELIDDTVKIDWPTRTIIMGKLVHKQTKDTFYVFANHWPSRRGGEERSAPARNKAGETLRKRVDYILSYNPTANIVIMGDFNDTPKNESILNYLKANKFVCKKDKNNVAPKTLYNLSWERTDNDEGSHYFDDEWNMLDQIIVSTNLVNSQKYEYICDSFNMYAGKNVDAQGLPIRTFEGKRWIGGYSDHLPVYAIIMIK